MGLGCSSVASTVAPSSAPPAGAVDAAFAAKATTICTATEQKLSSTPEFPYPDFNPSTAEPAELLPKVGAYFAQYAVPAEAENLAQLRALGDPASGQAAWDAFMSDWTAWVENTQAQATAAQASDAKGFIETVHWFTVERQEGLPSAASAAGVPICGSFQ